MMTPEQIKTAAVEYSKPLTWGPSVAIDAFTAGAQWMQEQLTTKICPDEKQTITDIYMPLLEALIDQINSDNSINRFRLGSYLTIAVSEGFKAGKQAVQEQYQWIPVTERWPEPLQRVNFVVDAPGIYEHGKVYGGTYTGEPHHENPRWRNGFSTPGCGYRASHWMPSFEPPAIDQPCT